MKRIAWILACLLLPGGRMALPEDLEIITIDAVTRQPVPARVSIQDAAGEWRWGRDARGEPLRYADLPRVWSPGTVRLNVAPGTATIIASRPYSHFPCTAQCTVPPGKTATITIPLKPAADLRGAGWYGGDAHDHVVHGERHHAVDMRAAAAIARSEGLDWAVFDEDWTSIEDKQPGPAALDALCRELTDAAFLAARAAEHPKDHLGHMAAFPLGFPASLESVSGANDYSGSLEQREAYAHFEIVRELRDAGSLSMYTHPDREYGGTAESVGNIARELPFDAVAAPWSLEALDVLTDAPGHRGSLDLWYFLLDRGHRLAACGFTDTCYDRRGERPGDTRTFVKIEGAERTMEAIARAIRSGRTFATTGPLVIFTVDGSPPGTVFPADGKAREARISAWNAVDYRDPRNRATLGKATVVRRGKVWKELAPPGPEEHSAQWSFPIEEREDAWFVVEVEGAAKHQFAVTSPVYFEAPGRTAPRGARAIVEGSVTDPEGRPVSGRVLALEHGKRTRRVVATAPLTAGGYRIECPADCRIEPEVEGLRAEPRSLFLHVDSIYRDLFWSIRRGNLLDPAFHAEIERRLRAVRLDIVMEKASGEPPRDATVFLEKALEHDGGDFLWFHPRVAAIPGAGKDGVPRVILSLQKHLRVSDHYSGLHVMESDDLGRTWRGPFAPPELDWVREPGGATVAVADVTPGWHAKTGRVLAVGARVRYGSRGEQLDDAPRSNQTAYSVRDAVKGSWSPWRMLEPPEGEEFNFSRNACSQWIVRPDGDILLPLYHGRSATEPSSVTVVRCTFDGERLACAERGETLRLAVERGLAEPSLVLFRGRHYLTLRNDLRGYVTAGEDGLRYAPIRPWQFDDGAELGSYNTQQHWLVHRDALYLAYTRRGAANDHVMRHRAPLFLARVDPEKLHVIRATERALVPERGATLGNFGAARVSPRESWVTVSEGIWSDDARRRGATGATFLARIVWALPDEDAP
jgi:hypothetical protein